MNTGARAGAISSAILLLAGAGSILTCGVPTARAEQSTPVSEADFTYFYKNPSVERAARLLRYFDDQVQSRKPGVEPPIIGFLAGAFAKYPGDIDAMIPEGLSPRMQGTVAMSLRLAGQDARARSIVDRLKASGAAVPDLSAMPASLDAVPAAGPSEFDLLWGASFATADPRYCSKILTRFAATANVDGNADDILAIARGLSDPDNHDAALHRIVDKRGSTVARELIVASSALWALNSNAAQHEFVRSVVHDYVTAHPNEPASKALLALGQQYGHYDIQKIFSVSDAAPGKSSVTINVVYFSQVLDDLGRHAGMYPPQFDSADDRQRAEHDVSAISSLLDPMAANFSHSPPLLLRLGQLHAIGHNLDIPDSGEKAIAAFTTLLSLTPDDGQANYRYGVFLAETTKTAAAIPYLEKAKALGMANADYWLGRTYLSLGEKEKAIENLQSYTGRVPGDQDATRMLDAARHGKVEIKTLKTSE
jgi:tetratricopeptide (TPR) repeat protein